MQPPPKLFARPWRLVENAESFGIEDAGGRGLAFVYFEDELILASTLKRLSKADARRLAAQIERLPDSACRTAARGYRGLVGRPRLHQDPTAVHGSFIPAGNAFDALSAM